MKRIEVDLKCMRSINRDQNSRMEWRRKKKKGNLHEEMEEMLGGSA